ELPGLHGVERHDNAKTPPGLVLYRFNAPVLFFTAPYFKHRVFAAASAAGPGLKWFVIDALPVTQFDVTGVQTFRDIDRELAARNIVFGIAGRKTELLNLRREGGIGKDEHMKARLFPTLDAALDA